jgi:hypothetical protein
MSYAPAAILKTVGIKIQIIEDFALKEELPITHLFGRI